MLKHASLLMLVFSILGLNQSFAEVPNEEDSRVRISISLGGAWEKYTGENEVAAAAGRSISGASHFDVDTNIGVYFRPTNEHLLFGVALDFLSDTWSKEPNFARVSQFFVGFTMNYYFQGEIGRGWYAHADLGAVSFSNSVGIETGRSTQATSVVSPVGLGVRGGGGYAFKVSDSVSLLAALDCGFRTAGAATAAPLVLSAGIMF